MRRFADLVALMALLSPTAAAAKPPSRVCAVLETRIDQSHLTLEGRHLDEALFEAAALDCPEIAARLLDEGASVAARNRSGATALTIAAEAGARPVAALLLNGARTSIMRA